MTSILVSQFTKTRLLQHAQPSEQIVSQFTHTQRLQHAQPYHLDFGFPTLISLIHNNFDTVGLIVPEIFSTDINESTIDLAIVTLNILMMM